MCSRDSKRNLIFYFFFFNDTATTEIYTLSLHDALPICGRAAGATAGHHCRCHPAHLGQQRGLLLHRGDRKSTRLNSSHLVISYAVFCLKKKYQPDSRPTMRLVAPVLNTVCPALTPPAVC